ncbi:MAG: hypothetical protein MJ010_02335 [Paludibacteraceae bacterium]|nr:hypothetical protein [Paludibacteraceae bacterium]
MDTNIVLSICQVVAVAIIPLLVWWIGYKAQNRQLRIEAKMQLFLKLMAKRNVNYITQEWVDSLNVIEVVFQDNIKVCDAWKDYHNSLNTKSPTYSQKQAYKLQLLSEMADVLGYKSLKQTDIANVYHPKYLSNSKDIKDATELELLRVLLHSKNLSTPMTDEEFAKRKKAVSLDDDIKV